MLRDPLEVSSSCHKLPRQISRDGFPSPGPMESFGCPNFPPWIRQFHSKGSMDLALEGNDEGPGDPLRESKLLAGPISDVLGQLGFHPR